MVSFYRKRGSVKLTKLRRTLALRERGVFVNQIIQVIIDPIALVSKLAQSLGIHLGPLESTVGVGYCVEYLRLTNRLSLIHMVDRIYDIVIY